MQETMNKDNNFKGYPWRFIARIVIEAETPLTIGNGEKSIMTDALVAKDVNGLPYIPGSSLAGVIRHALGDKTDDKGSIFGHHIGNDTAGSRIMFSDAVMIGKEGKALDGIQDIDFNDVFYNHFANLPVRQHVCINKYGTAEKGAKFDEQVVYKGTRFAFEIEFISENEDKDIFKNAMNQLRYSSFRLGGGTRKGFGKIKLINIKQAVYNLYEKDQLDLYLAKGSNLDGEFDASPYVPDVINDDSWKKYEITLQPQDFFLFGSGMGDEDADDTPVTESIITWKANGPRFIDDCVLIPASSVKGALAHRMAYYWNKENDHFAGDEAAKAPKDCPAVIAIFGSSDDNSPQRGNIIIDDMIGKPAQSKLFNHVKIDRFTGGAIESALFTEKVTDARELRFQLHILIKANDEDKKIFEMALDDLKNGLLPLGGSANRGLGMFMAVNN